MDFYKKEILKALKEGPKLRYELVHSLCDKKIMSIKKLEKTLKELFEEEAILKSTSFIPGTQQHTSLYAISQDADLIAGYKPKRKERISGRKPSTLEGKIKRSIIELKNSLKRNPTKEEIAIEVGKSPKEIERLLFEVAKSVQWSPPKRFKRIKEDEYAFFSDKGEAIRKDALKILREQGFNIKRKRIKIPKSWIRLNQSYNKGTYRRYPDFKALSLNFPPLSISPYRAIAFKDIQIINLGYARKYRFLINFLDEWNGLSLFRFIEEFDSRDISDSKFNDIIFQISYGKFNRSFLNKFIDSIPYGNTIIAISSSLTYFGPDKTSNNFRNLDTKILSKLNFISTLIRNKKLSNESIRREIWMRAPETEISFLKKIYSNGMFISEHTAVSFFSRWYGPSFIMSNMKSRADIRSNIMTMLTWIGENGDWL